ncbi:unnamed protein product [Coregonus sp. 'balchen']|nr:unnamed protein product [Coregonus sp. 'balchen']
MQQQQNIWLEAQIVQSQVREEWLISLIVESNALVQRGQQPVSPPWRMTCHVPSAVRSSQTRAPLLQPQLLQELPGGHLEAGRDQGLPRLQKHVSWGPAPCQPSPEEDACETLWREKQPKKRVKEEAT